MSLTKGDLIEIAKLVDNGYSPKYISAKYNYSYGSMELLVNRYRKHGIEGILHKKQKVFSVEEKVNIINRYYAGQSQHSLSIELNVISAVIYQRIKKYEQLGYNCLIDNRGKPDVSKMGRPKKEVSIKQQTPLTDSEREELNELRKKTYC